MSKILTAKEFVLKDCDGYLAGDYTPREVYSLMIGFAKLHVEAALTEVGNKVIGPAAGSIRYIYPLDNIK